MTEYFPGVKRIVYEGPKTDNPLAFRYYDANRVVAGKTMAEHLRFGVAYWHTLCNGGADQFGQATREMPWETSDPMQTARNKVDACFEFCSKLGAGFYCFHDTDVAPEGATLKESFANFDAIAKLLKKKQDETGVKLLWGTANCFSHPRFMHGAGTSCNIDAFAYAAAKITRAIEVTHELGGAGYVFWGGREGYRSLLNTDMKRELEHMTALLSMAVEHKRKIGFKGQFYIEPKPKEPTKHQYDSDAAACYAFLQKYGLAGDFKLNIEANHATLAGHDFQHELEFAATNGILGSVDANRGDLLLGWDTDQFPTDIYQAVFAMITILKTGGFTTGGLNFDAHVTRESIEPVDLFHAHIGAMDTFARGLEIAAAIIADGKLDDFVQRRYASWNGEMGKKVEAGKSSLDDLRSYMLQKGEITPNESGRIEMLENIVNTYIF